LVNLADDEACWSKDLHAPVGRLALFGQVPEGD
jgi:hypothetical protein